MDTEIQISKLSGNDNKELLSLDNCTDYNCSINLTKLTYKFANHLRNSYNTKLQEYIIFKIDYNEEEIENNYLIHVLIHIASDNKYETLRSTS